MSRRHIPARPRTTTVVRRATPPRAYVDPILDAVDALSVFEMVIHRPARDETLAFVLDDDGLGGVITVVSDVGRTGAVVETVAAMSQAGVPVGARRVVLATVRPQLPTLLPDDVERWHAADECARSYGAELVEWFVIGPRSVRFPRVEAGDPERW